MCRRQGRNTPEEVLTLPVSRKTIPDTLVIHVIRDGRDVALSLSRKRYIKPFPWKKRESVIGAAIYWERIVKKGQEFRPDARRRLRRNLLRAVGIRSSVSFVRSKFVPRSGIGLRPHSAHGAWLSQQTKHFIPGRICGRIQSCRTMEAAVLACGDC